MANTKQLEDRLKQIGCNFRFWGRAELRELANILLPGEIVEHCTNGEYSGGFAMLVATDMRVLLIDKKPMYLTLEDVRYDMISEVDYNHRLMDATIRICTPNKELRFTAFNQARMRKFFHFVQTRVMDIRAHYLQATQAAQTQQYVSYAQSLNPGPQQAFLPYFAQPASQQAELAQLPAGQTGVTPQQGMYNAPSRRTVAPIISAYTRLPMLSRQRRFLGSRAMNSPLPSIYPTQYYS